MPPSDIFSGTPRGHFADLSMGSYSPYHWSPSTGGSLSARSTQAIKDYRSESISPSYRPNGGSHLHLHPATKQGRDRHDDQLGCRITPIVPMLRESTPARSESNIDTQKLEPPAPVRVKNPKQNVEQDSFPGHIDSLPQVLPTHDPKTWDSDSEDKREPDLGMHAAYGVGTDINNYCWGCCCHNSYHY